VNIEIVPGAALNDPRLQQAVARRLERRLFRGDARRMQNILAHYPWREYDYKYGRWEWEETFFSIVATRYKWAHAFESVALLDQAGREIGEMTSLQTDLPDLVKFSGRFLFAGEPTIAGVYSPVGDGVEKLNFVWSRLLGGKVAGNYALTMRPGDHPALPQIDLRPPGMAAASRKHLDSMGGWPIGPWVVDHPDKPVKVKKD
jgi:hypothetical protein